ncbi:ABC transporter substrate-binding protein [Glaciimonas sp. PCH181]|uniref:ABC transporter substrate-binding protein n=1 Tax=Glaciimonas sp. PCH181 TaxID=2133943 RepID=UPI001374C941|nr:ABC transporter substrate-binding protein [Glaciimonas sp. PCH181]
MSFFNKGRRTFVQGLSTASALILAGGSSGLAAAAGSTTLSVAIPSNPSTFDPINQTNHDAMVVNQLIFENLIEIDGNGNRVPMLARALPNISPDGLTYTFDLRENVHFQNGQAFTAEDVKYSYEYILDPVNKAYRRDIWTPIASITVENPLRVKFVLKHPYRAFLDYMTKYMGIFPVGSREKYGADYFRHTPIGLGTGPAIFVESKTNDYIELKRNPAYWKKDLPKWEKLVIKVVPEESARLAFLMSNSVQIIAAPAGRDYAGMRGKVGIVGESKLARGSSFLLAGNNNKAPFDDPLFRAAVSNAIDRDTICNKVCLGVVEPSATPMPSSTWWCNQEANRSLSFNLEKAKALLQRSRYAKGAEFDLMFSAQSYILKAGDTALFIQSQLAQLGIKVNLKPAELVTVFSQVALGNHQAALIAAVSPADPTFVSKALFVPTEPLAKATGYQNPALVKLIAESYTLEAREKLQPVLYKIQDILAKDAPVIWIGTLKNTNLWRSNVRGFEVNEAGTLRLLNTYLA